jgi:hypothetical protein
MLSTCAKPSRGTADAVHTGQLKHRNHEHYKGPAPRQQLLQRLKLYPSSVRLLDTYAATMNPSSSAYVTHKRTRTGCQTCKRRRKRCDEQRPICEGCAKLGLRCVYDMSLRWGLTRDPFIERQRSIGSGPRSHDELGQVLHTIGSTSRLRMVIYSTLSASERQILLKCEL